MRRADTGQPAYPPDRRQLLAVSALPPWPMNNGYSLRVGNFLHRLAETWQITLVSPSPAQSIELESAPEAIDWIPVENVPATLSLPWRAERERLVTRLDSLTREKHYNAALLWGGTEFAARQLENFPPAVADRIDSGALQRWRDQKRESHFRQKIRTLRSALELGLYEMRMLRNLERLVATGSDDARALRLLTGFQPVDVIPNGVELPNLESQPDEADSPTVIFTGVLAYQPNIEAARFFALKIWPEVRRAIPTAQFVIAGRSPASNVVSLQSQPGVTVRPDVPDLTAEIRRAWIAVAPMKSGSGIKNKVLEAWAAARPVVLTELATNGLGLNSAPPSLRELVCSDDMELVESVVRLLQDSSLRRDLGRQARTLATQQHSWRTAANDLSQLLDAVSMRR